MECDGRERAFNFVGLFFGGESLENCRAHPILLKSGQLLLLRTRNCASNY